MNRRVGLLLLALYALPNAFACDVCGSYLSLYPKDRASFVSFLYKNRTLKGSVFAQEGPKHGGSELLEGEYLELYSTLEFRGNYFLSERLSVLASIPVVNRYRSIDKRRVADTYGIGDPVFLANYIVWDKLDEVSGEGSRVTLGGGLKVPLGRTDFIYDERLLDRDLQAGTGSWDPIASISYFGRSASWGVGVQWIGVLSGYDDDIRYGHSHNLNVETFYMITVKKGTLAPFAGVYGEHYGNDHEEGVVVENTSGSVLYAKSGARVWLGKWQLQGELQIALAEEHAAIVPANKFRVIAGLSYYL